MYCTLAAELSKDWSKGMRFVALAWDRIVEGNGTNSLAPSCGPDSGNVINNSRAGPSGPFSGL